MKSMCNRVKVVRASRAQRNSSRSAFTLIELLLVLVILLILAGVVIVNIRGRPEQARETGAKVSLKALDTAVEAFYVDTGRMPTNEEGLDALINPPGNVSNWHGPYVKSDSAIDPWGQKFVYRNPGTIHPTGFDIISYGADMREGNDDLSN